MKNKYPIYHYDIEQRSDAWFSLRRGHMSASNALAIVTNGKGLDTYTREIVADMLSTGEKECYTNENIDRGIELEPEAKKAYELLTGQTIDEVSFVEYNDYVGCSPDGLISKNGLLETKCPKDKIFIDLLLDGQEAVPSNYEWQCKFQLFVTGREWCDLSFYNPNFSNNLIVFRYTLSEEDKQKIKVGIASGEEKIKTILNKLQK